jgi:hypothetical protein
MVESLRTIEVEVRRQVRASARFLALLHDVFHLLRGEVLFDVYLHRWRVGDALNGFDRTESVFDRYQLVLKRL